MKPLASLRHALAGGLELSITDLVALSVVAAMVM